MTDGLIADSLEWQTPPVTANPDVSGVGVSYPNRPSS